MPRPVLHAVVAAPRRLLSVLSVVTAVAVTAPALAQPHMPPMPGNAPYLGEIALRVDATDLDHKILRVQQRMPVRPGPLTLYFPRWLPGNHAPNGDINLLAGLQISSGGKPVPWTRDPLDTHAFRLTVPAGASALDIEFQHLSPVTREGGRVVVTREMLNVQWDSVLLYPAGYRASKVQFKATLVLPAGWQAGTALRPEAPDTKDAQSSQAPQATQAGDVIRFKPVSLEMLVDSPVFAGRNFRRIELDPPDTPRPVVLNIVADNPDKLKPTEPQIEAHRELVRQADKLFASRHFAHYDFLFALSDDLGGIGLEHHQSSENGVRPDYWEKWERRIGARQLLPHEYTHSWNGKFRRPADLNTPDFNVPMQNSLLWLYEGQTQYWGYVLATRAGLVTAAQARDQLARTAASYDAQAGRTWRNLQDTTNDAIMASGGGNRDWYSYQRSGGDYYNEMLLIWLDADTLIREKTSGAKSLDDFAKAFFGVRDGEVGPLPYRFEDIVAALQGVVPNDWAGFLRQRLDTNAPRAPLDGLARSGWKLVFSDTPSDTDRADEMEHRYTDLSHSLGFTVGSQRGGRRGNQGEDTRINNVIWGGPAFNAGLTSGLTLVAVNNRAYKSDLLKEAIRANKEGKAPVELLVREGDVFRTVRMDYRGGLRYPKLERLDGSEDRLTTVFNKR